MKNKRTGILLAGILISLSGISQEFNTAMNKVKLHFTLSGKGEPVYSVFFNQQTVIRPSTLGFNLSNAVAMGEGFELSSVDSTAVDENWKPVWGEVSTIRNHYKEIAFHLSQKNSGKLMDIRFRVFEDGVGFRYEFPRQATLKYFVIADELTQFNMAGDHTAFWIPGDYDTNEYPYTTSTISGIDNREIVKKSTDIGVRTVFDSSSVQTPLMMKTKEGLYINIHEAALANYPAMQLHVNRASLQFTSSLVPDGTGNKAYVHAPFHTPWRTIIVTDKAVDILSSKLILNLNEPSVIKNTSWIKPMKFIGVWWELQTDKSGWKYADNADSLDSKGQLIPNGKHGANTANVKRYIDFAAKNGIKGLLVEGWNVGWEDWFGIWKEDVFDFAKPYPDFDVKAIEDYAEKNGVQMIMHNETSGSATSYERQMDTAFRFMKKYGYNSVKTGYVGKIVPRGEYHDGQWMVNHYNRAAAKAASYEVMIDMHESYGQPVCSEPILTGSPMKLAVETSTTLSVMATHRTMLPFFHLRG